MCNLHRIKTICIQLVAALFTMAGKLLCSLTLLHTILTVLTGVQETHLDLGQSMVVASVHQASQDLEVSIMVAVTALEVPLG